MYGESDEDDARSSATISSGSMLEFREFVREERPIDSVIRDISLAHLVDNVGSCNESASKFDGATISRPWGMESGRSKTDQKYPSREDRRRVTPINLGFSAASFQKASGRSGGNSGRVLIEELPSKGPGKGLGLRERGAAAANTAPKKDWTGEGARTCQSVDLPAESVPTFPDVSQERHRSQRTVHPQGVEKAFSGVNMQTGQREETDMDWFKMKADHPELFNQFFKGTFPGSDGAILVQGKFGPTEVRKTSEKCQQCTQWLPPGTEKFRRVFSRCYAISKSQEKAGGSAVKEHRREEASVQSAAASTGENKGEGGRQSSVKRAGKLEDVAMHPVGQHATAESEGGPFSKVLWEDERLARELQAEEDRSRGREVHFPEEVTEKGWTTVARSRGTSSPEGMNASGIQRASWGHDSPARTPLAKALGNSRSAKKQERFSGYPEDFMALTDHSREELEEWGVRHLLEPIPRGEVQGYWERVQAQGNTQLEELRELYATDDIEMLMGALYLSLEEVAQHEHTSDLYREFCEEWLGYFDADHHEKLSKLMLSGQLREVTAYFWRYRGLLRERVRCRLVEQLVESAEARGPPLKDFRRKLVKAKSMMSADVLAEYVMSRYQPLDSPDSDDEDDEGESSRTSSSMGSDARTQSSGESQRKRVATQSKAERALAKRLARQTRRKARESEGSDSSDEEPGWGKIPPKRKEMSEFKTFHELGLYVENSPGMKEELQRELEVRATEWREEYLATFSQVKREVARNIKPRLFTSVQKSVTTAKLETVAREFDDEELSVLDVVRLYQDLDDFMIMHHWSPWEMCMHLWRGEAYKGRLKKLMTAHIVGKVKHLSLTSDKQHLSFHHLVETALAYYQWKVALIQKVPQVDGDTQVWARLDRMSMPVWGRLSDWKGAYLEYRNEYAKLSEAVKSGPDLHRRLRSMCAASASSMSWIQAMESWKGQNGRSEVAWTVELIDDAVDSVHQSAAEGMLPTMEKWNKEKPQAKKPERSVPPTRTINITQKGSVDGAKGNAEVEQCYCGLRHSGYRNSKGCGYRMGKHKVTGEYSGNAEFAGYDPVAIAKITTTKALEAVKKRMEAAGEGDFGRLPDDSKKKFWREFSTAKGLGESESEAVLMTLNLCEMTVDMGVGEGAEASEDESVDSTPVVDSDDEVVDTDEDVEESDEDLMESLPRVMYMTTTFQTTETDDHTDKVTMLPVRLFQEGHPLLGVEKDGAKGKWVAVFVDGGSDLMGVNAEYCERANLVKVLRPRETWFRIDTSLEGMVGKHICKYDVEVEIQVEGQEFLGKDRNMMTTQGREMRGSIRCLLPVIDGLSHHIVLGSDLMAKYSGDDDKAARLYTTKVDGAEEAITCKTMRLPEACEWVGKRGGTHGKLVRSLPCWKRHTKKVRENSSRKTVAMLNARTKVEAGQSVWVPLSSGSGVPTDQRAFIKRQHSSLLRVVDSKLPEMEFGGKRQPCFSVVDQDVCHGACGVWVRNISPETQTLPHAALTVQVTPVYCEGVMKWETPESKADTERVYTMARAAREEVWQEGLAVPTPTWLQDDLKPMWQLVEPGERARMHRDAAQYYTPERLEDIQNELMAKLDINLKTSAVRQPWWEDSAGPSQVTNWGEEDWDQWDRRMKGETAESKAKPDEDGMTKDYMDAPGKAVDEYSDDESGIPDRAEIQFRISRRSRCTKGSMGNRRRAGGVLASTTQSEEDCPGSDSDSKEEVNTKRGVHTAVVDMGGDCKGTGETSRLA